MRKLRLALAAFTVLVCGCRSSTNQATRPDSSATATSVTNSSTTLKAAASGGGKSLCPRTGLWALCSVEKRLQRSGFVIEHVKGGQPRRAGFSVAPVAYSLGRSRLEVFLYGSPESATKDVAGLDTLAAAHAYDLAPAIAANALPPALAPFSSRRFDVPAAA